MESFSKKERHMETLVWGAAITGFALLFCATAILVYFNWSEKVFAPIYSILLVGTATALVTVLLTVKETTVENVFTTSIVLDSAQGGPPMINSGTNPVSQRITSRLDELFRLGRPLRNRGGQAVITIAKPQTADERFRFAGELLQYRIVKLINEMQRGGWAFGQVRGVAFSRVAVPMRLSKVRDYSGHDFIAMLATNRFSNSDIEQIYWDGGHFPLPNETKVRLLYVPISPSTRVERHVVRLEKPHYFQIDFVVEPLGGTGPGVLPSGVQLDPQIAAVCETYQLKVTMDAVFKKFTAGSSESAEYKDWVKWLFTGVQENLSD